MDWETVYREHSSGIYHYLLNLSGDNREAEDLLQDTFIRAMGARSPLREPDKMRSWLIAISRNLFLDTRKKHLRKSEKTLEDCSMEELIDLNKAGRPDEHAVKQDFKSHLQQALNHLSEAHRTAFTLGVIQKLAYKDIAEITGWSLVMVKTNIFRARKKVAYALGEFRG